MTSWTPEDEAASGINLIDILYTLREFPGAEIFCENPWNM